MTPPPPPAAKPPGPRAAVRKRNEAVERRQRMWLLGVLACVLVAGGALVVAATGSDDRAPSPTVPADPAADPIDPVGTMPTFASGPPADLAAPPPGATIDGPTPCPAPDGSSPRTTQFAEAPPTCIDDDVNYTAIVETTLGPLTILLNQDASPLAVNNFVVLARYHYYDDVPFHLVAPRGMVQAGDPVGDPIGSGGPGYELPTEIDPAFPPIYPTLMVAAVAEPPSYATIGSQFFIAAGDEAAALDPVHPVLGLLTDGMATLRAIEATGNPQTLRPTQDVRIISVEIRES